MNKAIINLDLDLYSFLVKLGSYLFLAYFFLFQLQSQPHIINQDFVYFNLSIVAFVFSLIFFVSLDFFGERKYKHFFWFMFIADVFILFSISEFGSLSPILFSVFLCVNILACSLVVPSALTYLVSGLSCFAFTIFFIRSGFADASSSVFFFVVNLLCMSLVAFLGQELKSQLFLVKEKVNIVVESLKKQKLLNQVVFDSMKSSIFVLNSKGSLISTNAIGEDLLSSNKFFVSRIRSLFSSPEQQVAHLNIDSKQYSISRSEIKYKDQEKPLGEVYLATDETQSLAMRDQLTEAEKLAAVGRLSAGLAHEIRNPLAGISGSIELLKSSNNEPSDKEENKRLYRIVMREIDRLNALVTEFLSFARPEVDKKDSISIKEFLSEVLTILKNDIRIKNLNIEMDLQAENYLLVVDENKFKQAMINILVNAAQATERNTFKRKVTIKGLVTDLGYNILISDNGMGIKKEDINKIFEPFHTTKDKGTGLGLAVTRRILESHGAKLSVDSKLGEGTSFSIIIPKSEREHGVDFSKDVQS